MNEGAWQGMSYRASPIAADRKTIVLIHGLSGSLSAWYPYEERLSPEFNVVLIDLRGHGMSVRRTQIHEYEPKESAADIAALLQHLGVEKPIIVSHSFGSIVAIELFRHAPQYSKGAVFISPIYGMMRRWFSKFPQLAIASLSLFFSHFGAKEVQGRVDYSGMCPTKDWDWKRIFSDIRNTGYRSYFDSFKHVYRKDWDEKWKEVDIPSIIIHGTRDSFVPFRFAQELSRILPSSRMHQIEGGNHMLPINNVDEVAKVVTSFARSI